jgi:uncharacterized membrane protein (DUF4010 family)
MVIRLSTFGITAAAGWLCGATRDSLLFTTWEVLTLSVAALVVLFVSRRRSTRAPRPRG